MKWLSEVFAPSMHRLVQRPWIAAISNAMQKNLPFILVGSLVFIYNVIRSYFSALPDLWIVAQFTFGLLGVITAFNIANQVMEKLGRFEYATTAALVAVAVHIMFTVPGESGIDMNKLGPSGILVGIIAGLFVALVFHLIAKLQILKNSSLSDFIVNWIRNIIPITVAVGITAILTSGFQLDIFELIISAFSPLIDFGQTLPGLILMVFVMIFFYSIGVSSWLFAPIVTVVFMAGINQNIELVAQGLPAINIVTNETIYTAGLIMMGGTGATLTLNVMMLFSKSKKLKTIGRVCITPSIFNINEPLVFGAPIVMNPLLMLPMWINSILGSTVVWLVMKMGLLNIPSKMIQVGQIPAPFSTVMITEDLRGILVYLFLFALYFAVWYPFFKVYERRLLAEEQAQG